MGWEKAWMLTITLIIWKGFWIILIVSLAKTRTQKDTPYYKALIEFHNKFSIPASCMVLGILAVPLGVQSRATRKSYGLGLGLVFFLLYYLLLSLGWVLGKSGSYPDDAQRQQSE